MKTVNINDDLHTRLKTEASARGLKLNEFLTVIVEQHLSTPPPH